MKLPDWSFLTAALLVFFLIGCAIDGPPGKQGDPGNPGAPGSPGTPGQDGVGTPGVDGLNSVTSLIPILPGIYCASGGFLFSVGSDVNRNAALEPSEIQHASFVCHGNDGQDGDDGNDGQDGLDAFVSPFAVVELIDPCGDAPGKFDELILRLANGMLLATISDNASGQNTRLGQLPFGTSWTTTDGTSCHVSVLANGTVTW